MKVADKPVPVVSAKQASEARAQDILVCLYMFIILLWVIFLVRAEELKDRCLSFNGIKTSFF
jgi:hypothetical protein